MADILLTTLNARYSHASLGLRYLLANMGELEGQTALREFTIKQRPIDIAEQILAEEPAIVGLGVYIWNVRESEELVAILKRLRPELTVILGGPEVSYEQSEQAIVGLADFVIPGQADLEFGLVCKRLLAGERPQEQLIPPQPFKLEQLKLPYRHYSDHDLKHRTVYVEA
ncbi:MAG: cobalamin B12-binding domain-containing protein, partial [Pseudomonadota bacterium]